MSFSNYIFIVEFDIVSIDVHYRGKTWLLKTLVYVSKPLSVLVQWITCWQFPNVLINLSNSLSLSAWIASDDEVHDKLYEVLFILRNIISRYCLSLHSA